MVNKLREFVINVLEEVEGHIDVCKAEKKKPFDNEEWYLIEDKVYGLMKTYLIGEEENE